MSSSHVDRPVESAVEDHAASVIAAKNTSWLSSGFAVVQSNFGKLDTYFPVSTTLKIIALTLALSWFAFFPANLTTVSDNDLGWHLRSGEWIMQHHQLPRTDPFSITGAGRPWVAYSWPFSVLIYEVAQKFDLLGIGYFTLFSWMAFVTGLFLLARIQGAGFWSSVGLTLVAGRIVQRLVAPRPGTITMLCFLVLLLLLLRERDRKSPTRAVWLIPFIFWVWSNVHVQFIYGLFILGLFCIEPYLDRLFVGPERAHAISPRLWIVLALSTAATVVNPYGFGPYRVILDFLHQPLLAKAVVETSPTTLAQFGNFIALLLILGAAVAIGRRRPVEPLWVVLFLWAAISSFRMDRDVWIGATVSLAFLATVSATSQPRVRERSHIPLYASIGVILVILVTMQRQPRNKDLLGFMATNLPLGGVAYIHENHLSGPLFNDYDWGGFLIYALPEMPVSIDGRTNIHGQDEVIRSANTWALLPGWENDPLLKQANLVIGSPQKPLSNHLATDPHFRLIYYDGTCVLFQRISSSAK